MSLTYVTLLISAAHGLAVTMFINHRNLLSFWSTISILGVDKINSCLQIQKATERNNAAIYHVSPRCGSGAAHSYIYDGSSTIIQTKFEHETR